ncbi:MAG: ATP-binding cassette domain-containing protein, partial [Flavobacteriaceae bacterium]
MAAAAPLLKVENLYKSFPVSSSLGLLPGSGPRLTVKAVNDVSFEVDRGRTLSLVGESGCGKSTVARLVTGLHRPETGHVLIDGTDVTALSGRRQLRPFGQRLQMIFQDPFASLNPRWRVGRIIAEPIHAFGIASDRRE